MLIVPRSRIARIAAGGAVGLALAGVLAACSSSGPSTSTTSATGNADSIAAALQQPTTLTVWAWAPQNKSIVAAFEKKYPKVKVNLVNAGTATVEYSKLQNAIKAGSGAPDIAQIEYYAVPQFALEGALANLAKDGLDSLKSQFSTAVWDSVNANGELVGLPQDTGPMALFYNKTVFDKYKLPVPTTWAQYVADAKKLHADNPKAYITNDNGDPGFLTSMIWSAGGHPYITGGTKNVTINLADPGSQKFVSLWSPLVSGGLVAPITSWTSQWYQGLTNGDIASLAIGGWMGVDLESGVPGGSGKWRVAPLPEWSAGQPATSENGGSSDAVLASSKNQLAAAGFLKFMDTGQGAQISAASGDFPASTTILDSSSFLNVKPSYFGGQAINQVLSQASSHVLPGWSYLPFQVYANSIFPDTVGQAYAGKSTLSAGMQAWQQQSVSYGSQQGFSITSK
jgi:multiple sugar transport system substrate-binding protein